MPDQPEFRRLWWQERFFIRRLLLERSMSLTSAEIGPGVIYVREPHRLLQQISANEMGGEVPLEDLMLTEMGPGSRYVWNPGEMIDLVNPGRASIEIVQIGFKEPYLRGVSVRDFFLIVTWFLQGDWHEEFKASVLSDIELIGILARRVASGDTPTEADVEGANVALRDLGTKVRWLFQTSLYVPMDEQRSALALDQATALQFLTGRAFVPQTQNGLVRVTVHTKDRSGTDSPNWRVCADPMGHKGKGTHTRVFGRLSTPTERDLAVADYYFWAEKGNAVSDGLKYSISGSDVLDLVVQ